MAQIAAAAGISRPALYQYFDNKDDVFASAFVALFDAHVDRALEAFGQPVSLSARLDLLLQRFDGDLWERLAASPYADEITSAKSDEVNAAVLSVVGRFARGVAEQLALIAPGGSVDTESMRDGWLQLLLLAPKGLKSDRPSAETFRRRLTTLARTVAADIEAQLGHSVQIVGADAFEQVDQRGL